MLIMQIESQYGTISTLHAILERIIAGKLTVTFSFRNYIATTKMRACGQTLCFQLQCQCHQEPSPPQPPKNINSSQFYERITATFQMQLKKQRDSYTREIDGLSSQIFELQNAMLRLQLKNQKDTQAEKEIRRQYNLLLQKMKLSEPRVINKVQVVERIKQVLVEVENKELENELLAWKRKYNEVTLQFQKGRAEKDQLRQQNQNLKAQIEKLNRQLANLRGKNQGIAKTVAERDVHIQKLNAQIEYLRNNRQVVVQTKHLFPEFRQEENVRTQTKIQTIYAEKPVERLVFVDVVKRVKEFIQPQRAVVNRIISCQEKAQCDCEQNQNRIDIYRSQNSHLSNLVERLENNVVSYKAQRQNLVKIISQKNSELNYLETKMKLLGDVGQTRYSKGGSTVNVQVTRGKQEKASTRNVSITQQRATAKR